ncbi:MAG: hypothetical protein AB7O44_20880 [Hyphomicrobiaceae bacterium]
MSALDGRRKAGDAGRWKPIRGGAMTPDEFMTRLEELRTAVVEKVEELEENPKWGSEDEREQLVNAIEELMVQLESLSDSLQSEAEDGPLDDDE